MGFHKVLVLEDDAEFRVEIVETLEDGFEVEGCGSVANFWPQYQRLKPELVMLDLGLPDGRGNDVIRELRSQSPDLGILVLSGRKDEADRVIALEFGADDYLVKPCGPRELVARAHAILRRSNPAPPVKGPPQIAQFAGFLLNMDAMELTNARGLPVPLTTAEFELLKVLVENPQRVLSRDRLLNLLRGDDWAGYDRSIDGLVYRLRKKLKCDDPALNLLKTVHGSGYIFAPPVRIS